MIETLRFTDQERLTELHKMQGFKYTLPPLSSMVIKRGFMQKQELVAAILGRPTIELYMLADPGWQSPRWRFEVLKTLHEDVRKQLEFEGYEDAFLWLPPEKDKTFGRRLERNFGWVRAPWTCMTRGTHA